MRLLSRLTAVLAVTTASLVLSVTVALAAPASWESVDVTVHADEGSPIMLVSGTLPEGTKLPAEVELSVPAGAKFLWAGEILGGDPSGDPSVEYVTSTKDGSDVYRFQLKQSLTGQVEVSAPQVIASGPTGYASNLEWTAGSDVKELRLNYRLPQTAKILSAAEGAEMTPGPTGYTYYSKTIKDVKAGQTETLAFTYGAAAPSPGTTAGTGAAGQSDTLVLVLVLGAALAFFAFLAVRVSRKMQAKSADAVSEAVASGADIDSGMDDDVASTPDPSIETDEPAIAPKRANKPAIILGLVLGAVGIVAVVAMTTGGKATVTGDTVMLSVAQVDACTTSRIQLTTPEGGDLKRDADKILALLKSASGVGNATINLKNSTMIVNYCESSMNETALLAALTPSGYVNASSPITTGPAGSITE
jgi:hypothetical protein